MTEERQLIKNNLFEWLSSGERVSIGCSTKERCGVYDCNLLEYQEWANTLENFRDVN